MSLLARQLRLELQRIWWPRPQTVARVSLFAVVFVALVATYLASLQWILSRA